ncbi:iron-containing redox enzyme family protein [Nannocystis pusilla]|uniref:iron-containing redox enzyme family protein n=1 Tax=Nannocystis pusilla TaxID=889268 RepID=UPI003DA4AC78
MLNASPTTTDREVASVRNLLDRAVASAFGHARPGAVPPLTATRWAWRLAGLYHLTHSTPTLLGLAAERFAAAGRGVLAAWARERAREESNHDRLALRDLRDLGYDAERVVERVRPATAIRMVDYFERSVHADDPIGCVGYAYAIERLAMTVREPDIRAVEAVLPAGTRATRCLRVHSAAGSDGDHVADTLLAVARLTADERAEIAEAARDTAIICFTPDPAGPPSDADIEAQLAPCRLH